MRKFPITLPLTDRDVQEGEEEAAEACADILRGHLALIRAIDKMAEEET